MRRKLKFEKLENEIEGTLEKIAGSSPGSKAARAKSRIHPSAGKVGKTWNKLEKTWKELEKKNLKTRWKNLEKSGRKLEKTWL